MGYLDLTYENYYNHPEYWITEQEVELPLWAPEIASLGGKGVTAIDFYDSLFGESLEPARLPEDYRAGEYGGIALELAFGKDAKGNGKKSVHRRTITRDLTELFDLIETSDNFCLVAPISYAGKRRTLANARYLYAMTIEIDGINGESGLQELFYSWRRPVAPTPKPTYIVCSGTGVHLYYVFERPIPLWENVCRAINRARQYLVPRLWSRYVSNLPIQFESVAQAFRVVGTRAKKEHVYAMAFEIGEKVTIEYINSFITDKKFRIENFYDRPKGTKGKGLAWARKNYPDWYQRRIVEGQGKRHYSRHPGIYYNWIEKITEQATVGHRYNCLEALCALGVQCNIPPEQVESDCKMLQERFELLTITDDNHFTEYDVLSALKTYHEASQSAYERNVDIIAEKTGIPLKRALRRGMTREQHLDLARYSRDLRHKNWREGGGRKSKESVVVEWQKKNPNGKKVDCIRETGLSKPTVYKWWQDEPSS